MVRVKHRYLLVNILYPEDKTQNYNSQIGGKIPDILAFRKPSPSYLTAGQLINQLRAQVSNLYGDYGAGMTGSGLTIKYFSQATSTFIVRCPRAHYRLIWSALTYTTALPKADSKTGRQSHAAHQTEVAQSCVMRVIRVSGTIRKSEEEAIRCARSDILKARRQAAESGENEAARGVLDSILGPTGILNDVGDFEDDNMEEEYDDPNEDDQG